MYETSVGSFFLRAVLRNAPGHGLNVPLLLQRADIPAGLLQEVGARVTAEQFATLQDHTMLAMNDEMLGYGHLPVRLGAWSAMCHWVIHARNFGEVLRRFRHFYAILERGPQVDIRWQGPEVHVEFRSWQPLHEFQPYVYELYMFSLHRLACWLVEYNVPVLRANFTYPAPAYSKEYRVLFRGGPSLFSEDVCSLVFERSAMTYPVRQTIETLTGFLRKPTLSMLVRDYSGQSWVGKTRAVLLTQLKQIPTLVEVAQQLDMHPKKLRRHLEGEGWGYSELKNQLRRDVAIRLLTRTGSSVEQIAHELGFSESSSFVRAFKTWTGVTPYSYRRRAG